MVLDSSYDRCRKFDGILAGFAFVFIPGIYQTIFCCTFSS